MIFPRLTWESEDGPQKIHEQKLKSMKRKGFTVVKWGGSNVDELPVVARDRFVSYKNQPSYVNI